MRVIASPSQFEYQYAEWARKLIQNSPVNRGPAHAMKTDSTSIVHEIMGAQLVMRVPGSAKQLADMVSPNLPWAEDHFQERVSGDPLNPAPSEAWWPYAQSGNQQHKDPNEKFSHTYPERYWPRFANVGGTTDKGRQVTVPHVGVRFEYGDLGDVVEVLQKNRMSRQAYLPVWFPEDGAASVAGQRVPCSLGYHFIYNPGFGLDCYYSMRSCDIMRFLRDDVYMTGRLLQWVANEVGLEIGKLTMNISNLHCFPADLVYLSNVQAQASDIRETYNFGAMG